MKNGGGDVFLPDYKDGRESQLQMVVVVGGAWNKPPGGNVRERNPRLARRGQGHFQEASVARISGPWRAVQINMAERQLLKYTMLNGLPSKYLYRCCIELAL